MTPSQQPRSVDDIQNLPSTGTSKDNLENTVVGIEQLFVVKFLSISFEVKNALIDRFIINKNMAKKRKRLSIQIPRNNSTHFSGE